MISKNSSQIEVVRAEVSSHLCGLVKTPSTLPGYLRTGEDTQPQQKGCQMAKSRIDSGAKGWEIERNKTTRMG